MTICDTSGNRYGANVLLPHPANNRHSPRNEKKRRFLPDVFSFAEMSVESDGRRLEIVALD
jgi:hypothetical protein